MEFTAKAAILVELTWSWTLSSAATWSATWVGDLVVFEKSLTCSESLAESQGGTQERPGTDRLRQRLFEHVAVADHVHVADADADADHEVIQRLPRTRALRKTTS